jgi:Caspase domain
MLRRTTVAALATLLLCSALSAEPARKRALLIGINDYSASRLPAPKEPVPARGWSNLDGAVNDVEIIRGMLIARYGFDASAIVTITDQKATGKAIRDALQAHLVEPAKKDDTLFFFYSGHGSQVRNSLSTEADKLDETLVPADSRHGGDDIRDKELRAAFNRILDRGARLTVILDACHSGSGARGLDGGPKHRAVNPDLRDVADPAVGPRPEDRGALILSATQDFDLAYEVIDGAGTIHGAFTWALARAMRDAESSEPAADTFLRAKARLRAEMPAQDPVIAGRDDVRLAPFFAMRNERQKQRAVLAVESVTPAGTYLLHGGWVDGITVGSELRVAGHDGVRLEITALRGISGSEARVRTGSMRSAARPKPGSLLEVASWAPPPARPLRVWIPSAKDDPLSFVQDLHAEAGRRRIRWVTDPTAEPVTHQLRHHDGAWELIAGGRSRKAEATLAAVPGDAALFVQLPVPAELANSIGSVDGVERTSGPETADYILAGRLAQGHIEYAWVRPLVSAADRARSVLPLRTAWRRGSNAALLLRDGLARLRKVHGWHDLASPVARSSYVLAVRQADDGALVENAILEGLRRYKLVLRARSDGPATPVYARYVHVFVIDSHGNGILLFPLPQTGTVENRLPVTLTPGQPLRNPPGEIALSGTAPFEVTEPYGMDSYFVLTTDEPLSTLASLEWDGVRLSPSKPRSALEELLAQTISGTRNDSQTPIRTPPNWSIEKVIFESVPPKRAGR